MKKMNLYLTDPQYAALKALHERTDLPMAEAIRRAIDAWLHAGAWPSAPQTWHETYDQEAR
jgi:hypothetical protein